MGFNKALLRRRFRGGVAPTILEQILASEHLVAAWVPGVSAAYQTADTSTPATLADDPVQRVADLGGNFPLYSSGGTARPLLKSASGVTWLEFDGSNDFLTSDVNHASGTYAMASAIGSRLVTVEAFRVLTNVNNDALGGGAQVRFDRLMTTSPAAGTYLFDGSGRANTSHDVLQDFTLTINYNGASSTKRVNETQVFSGLMGAVDPNGITIGAGRQASALFSYGHIRWYGTFIFSDYDEAIVSLAETFLAEGYTA